MNTNRRFAHNFATNIHQNIQIIDHAAIQKYQQSIRPYTHSNILSLHQINNILNTQTHTFSQWNFMQTNPAQIMIIDALRNILNKLSGNNVPPLLSNVLTQNEMLQLTPINNMCQAMKFYVNNTANKGIENKQKMLQILSPHLHIDTLKNFGFEFGKASYYRSKKKYKNQNDAISFINKTSTGRHSKKKNTQIQDDIYEHCMKNSDIRHQQVMKRASKRFGKEIVARQLLMTKEMLWNCYSNPFEICHALFFDIVKNFDQFKYGRKRTDLCDVCEDSKIAIKHINKCIKLAKGNNALKVDKCVEITTLNELRDELKDSYALSQHDRAVLLNKIDFMQIYNVHLKDVTVTKKVYIDMINNVRNKQCVVTIDYEEKAKIGNKSDEESYVFRELKLRNVLGFAFEFESERIYVGAVTNISNQTGLLSCGLMHGVMEHPIIKEKFEYHSIECVDFWFDRGSHFSNKVVMKWTSDDYPNEIMQHIDESNTHFHIGRHGKTYLDGIFGSYEIWMERYVTFHKSGIQSSADICTSLEWGVNNRCQPTPNVSYLFINMDIDGPYKDHECFYHIKQAMEKESYLISQLVLSQIKSFNHYFYSKKLQQEGMETEREIIDNDQLEIDILTLPSLKRHKTKNVNKILLRTKHLYTDEEYIERWHGSRKVKATKPKKAANVTQKVANIQEIGRQQKSRERVYEKQKLFEGREIMIDIDMNTDQYGNEIEHESKEALDYANVNGTSEKEQKEALKYANVNGTSEQKQKEAKTKRKTTKKKRKKQKRKERNLKCNMCEKTYSSKGWLRSHKRKVHNVSD